MLGYLRADTPGVIEAPRDGWYDTGDIVEVDPLKFVTILGRAKRFSKIAGEMVSLSAIEMKLHKIWPEAPQAVSPHPTRRRASSWCCSPPLKDLDRKTLADALKAEGATELMIPRTIIYLESLPLLGSGKTDYVTLNRMALDHVSWLSKQCQPDICNFLMLASICRISGQVLFCTSLCIRPGEN